MTVMAGVVVALAEVAVEVRKLATGALEPDQAIEELIKNINKTFNLSTASLRRRKRLSKEDKRQL